MNFADFSDLFIQACAQNGIEAPTRKQLRAFWEFDKCLMKTNEVTNLTAIRNTPDAIYKHYIDSLSPLPFLSEGARVLDLGCGPGFPSAPLAIMRPDLKIIGLDSTDKKISFLNNAAVEIPLKRLVGVSGRAEDPEKRKFLGTFDFVVSRAVSRLSILSELSMPYLKPNGILLAMKGAKAAEELREAQNAIKILGGKARLLKKPLITQTAVEERYIVAVCKIGETPKEYPRQYSAIIKKPL